MFNAYIPNIPKATERLSYLTMDGRELFLYTQEISSIISGLSKMKPEITLNFEKSFTYDWGNKKKAKMKPVKKTDILKNANILDTMSHLLRISAQVDERSMNMAPRMVRQEQAGFIDIVDTPEGGTCGLVRAKTVACIVTVDRDDTVIYQYLVGNVEFGGIEQNKLSKVKTEVNKTVCLLNSKFMGWCNGDSLFKLLQREKRKLNIYYETSLVLEKVGVEVLFIHTDGGRPIRPFLVVDPEDKQLVIDKKNLWEPGKLSSTQHFNKLIRKGAVEYLSPIEQSSSYVSMSVDFLGMKQSSLEGYQHKLRQLEAIEHEINTKQYYTLNGNIGVANGISLDDNIITKDDKENIEREEFEKLDKELSDEKEKLERVRNMTTDQINEIRNIENILLQSSNVVWEEIKETSLFKSNVTSLEKLKSIMEKESIQDEVKEYAKILYNKQKELYENILKSDVSKLEELTNGQNVEEYDRRFNESIQISVKRLQSALDIEQLKVNTFTDKGLPIPEALVKKMNVIQNRINEELNKKNIFPRPVGVNELKLQITGEKNDQVKRLLNDRLVDRLKRIEQLKNSIKYTFTQIKSLNLDDFILKIKYDIISYHKRELERKESLEKYTKDKVDELMKSIASLRRSSLSSKEIVQPEGQEDKEEILDSDNNPSDGDKENGEGTKEKKEGETDSRFKKLTRESLRDSIIKTKSLLSRATREAEFSYCEIDPNAIWGVSASVIPLSDRNQSIRNSYVCNHLRQMVGVTNTNPDYQMDTTTRSTAFPNRPLIEPQLNKIIGVRDMPIGATVMLAIATHKGMNQEDSLIVSQTAVDNGLFKIIKHKTIKIEISPPSTKNGYSVKEEITNVPANPKRNKGDYRNLINGIVGLGTVVDKGDPLVSITRTTTEGDKTRIEDGSRYATIGEDGLVDRITPPIEVSGIIIIKIRLLQVRNVVEGDKLGTLSGQKGTISKIVKVEDMPFGSIYNPKTGQDEMIRPDIIMNPHAIPSRMTLELLFEIILGRYAAQAGARVDATSFKNMDIHHFMNLLPSYGFSRYGTAKLYNGETGEFMDCNIMTGPTYYALLKHWVLDKIQSHGIKKKLDPQTGQPVKGRSNEGAIRMGAQERDALFAHGAGKVALERYCISSDRVEVIFCNNCGNLMDMNATEIEYECRYCHHKDPVRVKMPYGMVKFIRYMGGVGFKISFSFLKAAIPEIVR